MKLDSGFECLLLDSCLLQYQVIFLTRKQAKVIKPRQYLNAGVIEGNKSLPDVAVDMNPKADVGIPNLVS